MVRCIVFASLANIGHLHMSRKGTDHGSCNCCCLSWIWKQGFYLISCGHVFKFSTWPRSTQSQLETVTVGPESRPACVCRRSACVCRRKVVRIPSVGDRHREDWPSVSPPSTKSLQFNSQNRHWTAEVLVPAVTLRLPGHHGVVPGHSGDASVPLRSH